MNCVTNFYVLRYRLVRHMWQLNVNESLSMGASCSISNMATGELGVDVNIKNLNQVHHPLMTEIMLNDISLFSPTYQINSKKIICKSQLNSIDFLVFYTIKIPLQTCKVPVSVECSMKMQAYDQQNESI